MARGGEGGDFPASVQGPSETSGNHAKTILGIAPASGEKPIVTPVAPPPRPRSETPTQPLLDSPASRSTAPTIAPFNNGPATVIPERTRIVPGRKIPGTPFRIIRLVGEGGMGSVYEAEHEDIGRHVALKILHPEQCQKPHVVEMFRNEARAATRIGSKYIVDVLDFDELKDGRVMIVMELLDTVTLDDLSREGSADAGRIIGILRQACKGIGAAHAANIIHRDIKPENIMLCNRDGRSDFVKLVDFGISTIRQDMGGEGRVVGTPEYVSPEQAAGLALDGRSDMYSLACTAYAAFAGRPPFHGDTLIDILTMHLTAEPKPFAHWRPDHGCPPQLEAVLRRALGKKPEDRFADMADFEAAICEAQIAAKIQTPWDDLPIPEVADARRERLLRELPGKFVAATPKRARIWIGAALASAAALAAAWYVSRPEPAPAMAIVDDTVERIVNDARTAGARAYYVYPPMDDVETLTAYQQVLRLEELEGDLAEEAGRQAETLREEFAATLVRIGDLFYSERGGEQFGIEYYIQALIFDPEMSRRDRVELTAGEIANFRRKAREGDFTRQELLAAQPLKELQEVVEPALAQASEGAAEVVEVDVEAAVEEGRRVALHNARRARLAAIKAEEAAISKADDGGDVVAVAPSRRASERDPDDVANDVARAIAEAEAKAEAKAEDPLPSVAKSRPRRDPAEATEFVARAEQASRSGNRSEAMKLFRRAVDRDGNNATALIGLSDLYFDRGSYRDAIRFAERAVETAPRNGGYRIKLGDAQYKRLMYTEAREQYEKAKSLGHPGADRKLEKIRDKVGG